MANRSYEFSAKSAEEAIEEGLLTLGLTRDAVTIEVINRGSRGILGFGSEPAMVRLTVADTDQATPVVAPQPAAEDDVAPADQNAATPTAPASVSAEAATEAKVSHVAEAQEPQSASVAETAPIDDAKPGNGDDDTGNDAQKNGQVEAQNDGNEDAPDEEMEALAIELLSELIDLMGFEATIVPSWEVALEDDSSPYLNLDIQGEDLGILIGRRGETLANLQFLLRLMINQRLKTWKNIVIDVEQYKQRRVDQLTHLANRMAEQVATSGRPVSLEPMPANERRIIHIALRENPAVYTDSTGEGERRKITILPR